MTDEKNTPAPAARPDFGEIQISPGCTAAPRPRSTAVPAKPAAAPPEEKTSQRKKVPPSGGRGRVCLILLLLLPPALFLTYLAAMLYFLPMQIKGPLAERLGRQLGRPVHIGQASLSPFSLALRLSEITLGPATAHSNEPELARIEAIEARLRPASLLQGRAVLDDLRIDRLRANLLRRQDGSFNALPPGGSLFGGVSFLPDWLRTDGLKLHRSTVHFLDQPSGKEHLVEHIEFTLPPAGQGAEPTLSAVVNSSPLLLTGQKQTDGGPETRLTLKLDNLDPQQYAGLLPGLAKAVSLNAKRTDAVLEVILNDAGKGLAVTGAVTFSELLVQSADHEEQPEQAFKLTVPTAHLIVRFNPMQKLWTAEELMLDEPQLDLPENQGGLLDGTELAGKAAALLNADSMALAVGKASLSKGLVRSGKKEWTDLQLELTGFRNAKAAELTKETAEPALSLSAGSGNASVSFKGNVDPACNLSGSLILHNMQADLLRPYLSANEGLRFSKGSVDITGELRLEQQADGKPVLKITGGTVAARDCALQQKKAALLAVKTASAADCVLDGAARSMSCGKAALDGADFVDTGFFLPGVKKGKDSAVLRFSCTSLELKNSAAKLPFGSTSLPLSGLKMSMLDDKSLKLTATAGKKGSIELSGTAAKSKDGAMLLSGKLVLNNAEADLLHSYLAQGDSIRFSQGSADISGSFSLSWPTLNLSNGTVAVHDFSLQREGTALLSGKTISGADCSLDGGSQRMSCGSIIADGADFADSGFFLAPAGTLRFAAKSIELKNSAAKFALGAANLPLSGLNMQLSGLPGQISVEAAAGSGKLEISGTAAKIEAGLALAGNLTLRNSGADILQPCLGEGISFSKGSADLSGSFTLNGPTLNLSGGAVTLRDFSLHREGAALLSGASASGTDCVLDGAAKTMHCASLTADGADFADSGFFLASAGTLRFAAKAVELKNASTRLALGGTVMPLSGLNLSLSGLPGPVSLKAAAGAGKLEISGTAAKDNAGLELSGTIALNNADAALLNASLGDELRFSKGSADISGTGRLSRAGLQLSSGSVAVHDFSLQHSGTALLSGKSASGADCSLDGGLSCGTIALEGADFAAAAPGFFFQPSGRLRLAANAVEISGSSALLPVGSALLPLSGLKMSATGLRTAQQQPNNFQFAAAVGQGSLKAEGQLRKDGSGTAALTAERLDLRLFSKAFANLFRDELTLKQGSLSGKGEFKLPENRFSGSISLDNLAAETSRGDSLRWRRAAADKTAFTISPFAAAAEKFVVDEPQLQLSGEGSLPSALTGLLAAPPLVSVDQCAITSGSLQRGGKGGFTGIQGQIGPIKAGVTAAFSFSGKMGGSDFTASGKTGKDSADLDKLAVERLPLDGAAKELAKQLALDSSQARLTRTVSAEGDRLNFSGFIPQAKSDYAFVLALLTDKDGAFSMPLQAVPFSAPDDVIVKIVTTTLQKLRDTPPWTALEKITPNLPKERSIDFLPGDKVPDFMAGLDGLRQLGSHPHLGWSVKGCYDQEADRKALLAQTQKSGGQKVEEENARRKQELDRLLAQEVLRQMTLNKAGLPIVKDQLPEIKARPDLQPLPAIEAELRENVLAELARARAAVVREHLVSKLGIPAERVKAEDGGACGAKAELNPAPFW
jgi:hypothetical protein